ncbi:MAG: nitroreductase family protein [Muribaculum sp.]|nr:nitroreductase family protein [Muribaculum sp.]
MKKYLIIIITLAIAIGALSYRLATSSGQSPQKADHDTTTGATIQTQEKDIIDCIMSRASVRDYSDREISQQTLDTLLRAGMAAPTAMNKQPWQFIVIDNPDILSEIADALGHGDPVRKCKTAIVACGDLNLAIPGDGQQFWVQDVSAASENILLAAHAMGLGAVWCGIYPIKERVNAISEILEIPNQIIPLNIIAIGYPASPVQPKDKWDEDKIHRNVW